MFKPPDHGIDREELKGYLDSKRLAFSELGRSRTLTIRLKPNTWCYFTRIFRER